MGHRKCSLRDKIVYNVASSISSRLIPIASGMHTKTNKRLGSLFVEINLNKPPVTIYNNKPVEIIGENKGLLKQIEILEKYAASDLVKSILIYGETGTGKELFAKHFHEDTGRDKNKYAAINCAGLNENLLDVELFGSVKGAFTGAENKEGILTFFNNGTVFLDEAHTLNIAQQNKLLRFIETGELKRVGSHKIEKADVRLIFGVNENPKSLLERGIFKKDFYNRISNFVVNIPPLRERKNDIELLVQFFIYTFRKEFNKDTVRISKDVMEKLKKHNWRTGNIRELRGIIEKMIIFMPEGETTITELPEDFTIDEDIESIPTKGGNNRITDHFPMNVDLSLDEFTRRYIKYQLEKHGSVPKAAGVLKVNHNTLHSRMKKLGIKSPMA